MQIISATSATVVSGQTVSSKAALGTSCPGRAMRQHKTAKVLGRRAIRCPPRHRQALMRSSRTEVGRSEDGGIEHFQHHKCRTVADLNTDGHASRRVYTHAVVL